MVVFQDLLLTYVFNTYIDGLLFSLQSSDLGCHIGSEYIGCMAYADDVIIISASIIQLQAMLDICVRFRDEMDTKFNAKKSCLFIVGINYKDFVSNVLLGNDIINWSAIT